jgi:hypothetical protein
MRMRMARTGQIPECRAMVGAILLITMTMMTARVRRKSKRVRKELGKGMCIKDGNGKEKGKAKEQRKGKGKGNGKGKSILKQTPGADDISCAVGLQLLKDIDEADSDKEG